MKCGNNLKCTLAVKAEAVFLSTSPGWACWLCEQATRWWSVESWLQHSLGPSPVASCDILSQTIQRLVLFQESCSALLPPPFHTLLLGEVLQGLTQPGLWKAIRANYRYPVTSALGQARWGAQRPGGRAGVSLGQKDKASLGPTLSECLPGSMNW